MISRDAPFVVIISSTCRGETLRVPAAKVSDHRHNLAKPSRCKQMTFCSRVPHDSSYCLAAFVWRKTFAHTYEKQGLSWFSLKWRSDVLRLFSLQPRIERVD